MTATETRYSTREEWLVAATRALGNSIFDEAGFALPTIRVSVGWPGGRGRKGSIIGQCWAGKCATDGVGQIFISPVLDDASRVLDVLAHELCHGINFSEGLTDAGHGRAFSKIARAIGLTGKMTATVASDDLKAVLDELAEELGAYPHAALSKAAQGADGPKKQGTRMIKVECENCGYTCRTTRKWLDEVGPPFCACSLKPVRMRAAL